MTENKVGKDIVKKILSSIREDKEQEVIDYYNIFIKHNKDEKLAESMASFYTNYFVNKYAKKEGKK